ncbi:hypothetical protein SEVIR_3G390200v4 [Setaria viridis]|uniref:VAN3-binding protein-like auxin canalisation domain-containing protein n=2 Tax=Setaria TaxID=4554 RepID=A0A368QNA4_SETIT|nr:uncharacterized protein LOC101780783 [Setaria italica]XP_034585827.1 uncharacterized protein LOC117848505 [Setaria viridis]RCV19294.1 hypothetical protein SETIT_3G373100v2 [Setaria italica]TKW29356.1 hypothetical protein SEVIR_3G390200v2 [Setaria viridis]
MSSTAAPSLANLWLGVGELAAAVQGTWQAAAAGHGGPRQRQRKLGGEKTTTSAVQGAAAAGDGDVGRCGGAMSDTTLYLLLDRFSPS